MTEIPILTATICDAKGVKIAGTAPLHPRSGRFVLSTMDTFPTMEAIFGADERANIALLAQNLDATLQFFQRGLTGPIAWCLLEDPATDILDAGDTITLTLRNITDQLTRNSVGLNAQYETTVGAMVAQIGAVGESVEWETFYDSTASTAVITGFTEKTPLALNFYNAAGDLIGSDPARGSGAAKQSPWTAVALDDGPPTTSSSAVRWASITSAWITFDASNLAKLTAAPNQYTDGAGSLQAINYVFDAGGAVARSDGSFTWEVADVLGEVFAGLAPTTVASTAGITYGWWVIKGAHPTDVDPATLAYPIQFGAQMTNPANGGVVAFVVRPGDLMTVALDYSNLAHPQVVYMVNGNPQWYGTVAPTLPLMPSAFLVSPGALLQNPMLVSTVYPSQQVYAVTFPEATPLEALTQIADGLGIHVRQRTDGSTGAAVQSLEVGAFGAQTGIRLTGGLRADRKRMLANPQVRLITALTWTRETGQVINTITPLGAPSTNGPVDLERLYWIVHNPQYPNYRRYGAIPGTVFPEYDDARYPIRETLDRNGNVEYWVRDTASYDSLGFEIRGKYSDPQFTFGTSTNVAAQELTARALYIATVAKLKWESQINDTLEITTVATFRPPKAGDRVRVDFRRIGADVRGNFAVMTTQAQANLANPYVTMVERTFAETGEATDKWTLSFLPRQPQGVASNSGSTSLRNLEAIKIIPTNTISYLSVYANADVDANATNDHSLIATIRIPSEVFRVTSAPLDVTFSAMRSQVTTSENSAASELITIPTTTVTISTLHGAHTIAPLSGGAYDATLGFKSSTDAITDVPVHFHQVPVLGLGPLAPTASTDDITHTSHWMGAIPSDGVFRPYVNNSGPGVMETNPTIFNRNVAPTAHPHHSLTNQVVTSEYTALTGTLIGLIDPQTFTAPLVQHVHAIRPEINDTFAPTLVDMDIDPGTGVWTSMRGKVFDQISGTAGPWTASFFIPDLSLYVNKPGKLVRIRCRSLANDNLGIGHLVISGQWRCEIGGIGSTVFTQ